MHDQTPYDFIAAGRLESAGKWHAGPSGGVLRYLTSSSIGIGDVNLGRVQSEFAYPEYPKQHIEQVIALCGT